MKKYVSFAIASLFAISLTTNASAHSHLQGSNPADGDVLHESLQEISLNFDGEIMEGSYIELTNSQGIAIEVDDIIIGDGVMTATVAEPLENEQYEVDWSIVSGDGHALTGDYSFTVDAPVVEETDESTAEESEDTNQTTSQDIDATQKNEVEEDSNSSFTVIGIIIAVIIIVAGVLLLNRRKK